MKCFLTHMASRLVFGEGGVTLDFVTWFGPFELGRIMPSQNGAGNGGKIL